MSRRRNPEGRRLPSGGRGGPIFPLLRRFPVPKFRAASRRRWSGRLNGAIAQLGERYNGIVEVTGSIPVGSTNSIEGLAENRRALRFSGSGKTTMVALFWYRRDDMLA